MTRYAMYGGSFDPIHIGHLSVVERAIAQGYTVLVAPAYRHAFGKQSAPFEHRLRMCDLALQAWALTPSAQVCDIERRLANRADGAAAPVYTYDVLCALRERLGAAPSLLVGPDIAAEWGRWHRHADIDHEFGRVALSMTYDVRSSTIRQQIAAGRAPAQLDPDLPVAVRAYIAAQGLYL